MVTDGEVAGRVGDVRQHGDKWGFTVYDRMSRELCAFAFHSERDARQAAKMMQDILARAASVSQCEEFASAEGFGAGLRLLYEFDWT